MTAVKAECQRIGVNFKMVLTITLDNYSYANFGPGIQYTITGGSSTQTLMANLANTNVLNIHEFTGVNLSSGVTYSITADIPPIGGSGGVGGNTLTFVPIMKLCAAVTQVSIDSGLIIRPHVPCTTLVNLIPNGNFMYGNDGSFQSDLPPGCNSCTAGSYCAGKEFSTKCSSWPAATWDHTLNTSSGSYLLVDGNPAAPSTVWFTNVKVCKGVTYTFSFWAKSLYADAFNLGFMINNALVPVTSSTVTVSGASIWRQYTISWPCSLPTGTTITIGIEQLTGGHKRDFGIDDVFFGYCCNECNVSTPIEEECVIDIDTTIVKVSCGNIVNISSIFDGTPSSVTCTIYDSIGNVIFTALNTATFTFALPGTGVFYGVVEASCGGGDANGGDEDEDVFDIVNLAPVADFRLNSTFNCVGGQPKRSVTTLDYSNEEGTLSYLYRVTDIASGTNSTYTVAEPAFSVDAKKSYDVVLTVTDSKGCTAQKTMRVGAAATCKAKFDWWYSWCDDQCTGTKKVTVNFDNQSEFTNCSTTPTYKWDYGDGTTGTVANHVYDVPCDGKSFSVSLTMTFGAPGDADYCQSIWDTVITVDRAKPLVGVSKICCDGLVFFYTNATKGKWTTPGSLGIPKFPAVSKKIWKPLGIQVGQNYRQYYSTPGTYYVTITGAETENHNKCPVREVPFKINAVECFNRNVKSKKTDVVDGVTVKYKFTALALPLVHRMKSKISAKGGKKLKEISTDFSGTINKKGADGCFCTPQPVSKSSGMQTNKRKAKAATSTNGKFRIGMNKATATFYVKTNGGTTKTWTLGLGYPPCDYPWMLFF